MKALSEATSRVLDRFADGLWLNDGLARNTLESYRRDLRQFASWLDEERGKALLDAGADLRPCHGRLLVPTASRSCSSAVR